MTKFGTHSISRDNALSNATVSITPNLSGKISMTDTKDREGNAATLPIPQEKILQNDSITIGYAKPEMQMMLDNGISKDDFIAVAPCRKNPVIKDWPNQPEANRKYLKENPHCNAGLLTRTIRALDVDIDDSEKVGIVLDVIKTKLGEIPIRTRSNSARVLIPVIVEDSGLNKQGHILLYDQNGQALFCNEDGKQKPVQVEILASDGKQFVFSGVHPSGVRYEWKNNERKIPRLSVEEFNALLEDIAKACQSEVKWQRQGRTRTPETSLSANIDLSVYVTRDPIAQYLTDTGKVIGNLRSDGGLNIECAFKYHHSMNSGKTETVYFPAGTRGFSRGHFKCMHAKCGNYTDEDFLKEYGYMDWMVNKLTQENPVWPLDVTVKTLAGLDDMIWITQAKTISKAHNISKADLLGLIKRMRPEVETDDDDICSLFPEIEPWDSPVDLAMLLDEMTEEFLRYMDMTPEQTTAMVLWVVMSWLVDELPVCPLLIITSAEKGSGKSTAMEIAGGLVYRRLSCSNISSASIPRIIDKFHPTLCIDEADTFMQDNEVLRGVINAGHTRGSAGYIRFNADKNDVDVLPTFGAKIIAGIGNRADTIMDRAIVIRLERKKRNVQKENFRCWGEKAKQQNERFGCLIRQLCRWSIDHAKQFGADEPAVQPELSDRHNQNWFPLWRIADMAGKAWPEKARHASLVLSGNEEPLSEGVKLLNAIRTIWHINHPEISILFSNELVSMLNRDETLGYALYFNHKGITPDWVAKKLKPYDIAPRILERNDSDAPDWVKREDFPGDTDNRQRRRGYALSDFHDAFNRYLLPMTET